MAAAGKSGKSRKKSKVIKAGNAARKQGGKIAKKTATQAAKKNSRKTTRNPVKTKARQVAGKKVAGKKVAGKNALAKKTSAKKTSVKKTLAKKTSAKKTSASKNSGNRTLTRRTFAKKSPQLADRSANRSAGRSAPRKTSQSRRTASIVHPPFSGNRRLSARTPIGWQATVTRMRGFSAKELQELRAYYEPRSFVIRDAGVNDHPAISHLLSHAFSGSAEDDLVRRLRDGGDFICELVGEYHGVLIAHAGFTTVDLTIDGKPVRAAALAPLAVEQAFRGLGIGRRMVVNGTASVRSAGAQGVFVHGDQSYYAVMGFSGRLMRKFASAYPLDQMSVLEFAPGALAGSNGVLTYPASFESLK